MCTWPRDQIVGRGMSGRKLRSIVTLCICALVSGAHAAKPSGEAEIAWLGLYNAALIDWRGNENRLEALCSHAAPSPKWRECRDEKMRPKRHVVPLRSAPDITAAVVGELVIQATPGEGLRAYYRPATGQRETEFVPDLFDADWGYGPFFHQTALERRGTWFLLPSVPFSQAVWVNASDFTSEPDVRLLEVGEIIKIAGQDLVFLGLDHGVARTRAEQSADMWCEEGEPPALKPSPEIRVPVEKLYRPTGHLLVDIKYKRGC